MSSWYSASFGAQAGVETTLYVEVPDDTKDPKVYTERLARRRLHDAHWQISIGTLDGVEVFDVTQCDVPGEGSEPSTIADLAFAYREAERVYEKNSRASDDERSVSMSAVNKTRKALDEALLRVRNEQ